MPFSYAPAMAHDFPELATQLLRVQGITPHACTGAAVDRFLAQARQRLAQAPESELPEIQAWRRGFARMGLKPTQYRCAAEALLRRLRKEGGLPALHPLVDLCNAASVAFAIPIAVLDLDRIGGSLQVRPALGTETYETFSGEVEQPEPGEIIFADQDRRAHARRWCNRQSGHSAVAQRTTSALIVAEALHAGAAADTALLMDRLQACVQAAWPAARVERLLPRQA